MKWQYKCLSPSAEELPRAGSEEMVMELLWTVSSLVHLGLEFSLLHKTCVMHLKTLFPRGQHLLTAGF